MSQSENYQSSVRDLILFYFGFNIFLITVLAQGAHNLAE